MSRLLMDNPKDLQEQPSMKKDKEAKQKKGQTEEHKKDVKNDNSTEDKSDPIIDMDRKEKSFSRMKMRKQSLGMSQIQGITPLDRTSYLGLEFKRPLLVYLPTYQINPSMKFYAPRVTKIVNKVIDEGFSNHIYSDSESPVLAVKMATTVLRKVKALQYNRYRVLVIVTIAQRRAQSFNNAITFLWDADRDGYVDAHKEVATAFVQVESCNSILKQLSLTD